MDSPELCKVDDALPREMRETMYHTAGIVDQSLESKYTCTEERVPHLIYVVCVCQICIDYCLFFVFFFCFKLKSKRFIRSIGTEIIKRAWKNSLKKWKKLDIHVSTQMYIILSYDLNNNRIKKKSISSKKKHLFFWHWALIELTLT